ncbi:MAG: hypothetical protein JOZ58_04715 [Acetobacteraceae bacterium]|nr:hypothetical protein [Acetobacteraceae bacterium]
MHEFRATTQNFSPAIIEIDAAIAASWEMNPCSLRQVAPGPTLLQHLIPASL